MGTENRRTWIRKTAALAILPLTTVALSGCNNFNDSDPPADENLYIDNEEESDDTLDSGPFDEDYDQSFYDEPLLVVHAENLPDLEPGTPVVLTGQVYEYFDLTSVEEELGVDLEDSEYEEWDNEPYLLATAVEAAPVPTP